ncbi:hypothetical protein LCR01_00830 [Companilactobacillus crustorum]|uniref:Uncharacterized protein n=2 Tax=Companilactobacillus TaxID=2767879 RepID=A0A2P4R4C7_9LACO|nr:LasU family protein [Companilactobacillus crustorum]WDT66195.1 LasU family protein [Companilactobacillus crustorum]GEO75640.1 hypothetical protein LCR01_00830 [Companilactobacillus crustorum]HCD07844.1 hypothetical protein [Lactobacillus sp.]
MKIRRTIEVIPTFILIIMYCYSLYLRVSGGAWNNSFVISITGLSVYIPIISFFEAMVNSSRNLKYKKQNRLFYLYMIVLWVLSLIIAILSMEQG